MTDFVFSNVAPGGETTPSMPMHHDPHIGQLVLNADVTKNSANSGDWSNPSTWYPTGVPADGDKVVINAGHAVNYDVSSTESIHWMRIDGTLSFKPGTATKLVIETLVASMSGRLEIGTEAAPITATAEILIADNGAFNLTYDTHKLSRGVLIEGNFTAHGKAKEGFFRVNTDPVIGATSVVSEASIEGWEVGDKIIIAGTVYKGWYWNNSAEAEIHHAPQDEERIITSFSTTNVTNDTVHFSGGLIHEHKSPPTRSDLKGYVGNWTRNIKISTENASSVPIHERGHIMIGGHMARTDGIRFVEFYELGRTDKSINSIQDVDVVTMTATTNVRGRYALHFHHTGYTDTHHRNQPVVMGNAIYGSPGWGIVQHFSCGNWYNNVAYGCFGAAYASEAGVESGTWNENLAVYCKGKSWGTPKSNDNYKQHDSGQMGDGFHMVGRTIRCFNNVAMSCNDGFTFFTRPGTSRTSIATEFQIPDALKLNTTVDEHGLSLSDFPIIHFKDNVSVACNRGLYIEKSSPNQHHDFYTTLEHFTAWNVFQGFKQAYTARYSVHDFDLVAVDTAANNIPANLIAPEYGFNLGNNVFETHIVDALIEGFTEAAILTKHKRVQPEDINGATQNISLINPTIINCALDWEKFRPEFGDNRWNTLGAMPGTPFSLDVDSFTDLTTSTGYSVSFYVNVTKTDEVGTTLINEQPYKHSETVFRGYDIHAFLLKYGYFTDIGNSNRYVMIPMWFTNRLTAEHNCRIMKVTLHASRSVGAYTNNGDLNASNNAPTASDITGQTASIAVFKTFDLVALSRAANSDGDAPQLLAAERTVHADVFDNGDGTVDYKSDFGFTGADTFPFWIHDGHGGVVKKNFTLEVS